MHKWHCSDAPYDGGSDSESNIGDNVFADNSIDSDTVDDSIGTGQWDSSLTEDEMPFWTGFSEKRVWSLFSIHVNIFFLGQKTIVSQPFIESINHVFVQKDTDG